MSILTVKVNCNATADFSGYRLHCSYVENVVTNQESSTANAELLLRPGLATCSILPTANRQQWLGELKLPPLVDLEGLITITVQTPDGSTIQEQVCKLTTDITSIELTAASFSYPSLLPSSQLNQLPVRLRGRVIDAEGQAVIAGEQVFLTIAKTTDSADTIVAAGRTDGQGYFSLDFKSTVFSRALIKVANHAPQPLALVDGKLPERVIISVVANASPNNDKEGDCSCAVSVPSLPDAEDIINAPTVYTSDLSGGCVVLNKPNRTIEEFDFYGVVRTTQPDIVGFSLPEPQYLRVDQIVKLGQTPSRRPHGAQIDSTSQAPKDPRQPTTQIPQIPPTAPATAPSTQPKGEPNKPPGRGSTLRSDLNPAPGAAVAAANGPSQETVSNSLNKLIDPRILKNLSKGRGYTEEVIAEAAKQTEETLIDVAVAKSMNTAASRAELTAENPLDWDSEPTFYQAATVAHGHVLHFKQVWKANGFSLGDLLYSLPLAPGQKRQVAVLDWERREIATRTESLEAEESLAANLTRDRDINEIVSASLSENVVGASLSLSGSKGSSQGSSGPGSGDQSALSLVSGSAGGIGAAGSVGFQHGSRKASATSLQKIRDRIGQAASALRSQRSTVVQSVTQGETLRAQTEVIANYNHCHAITVEYFEVLRHFAVQHKLVDVQECLFVPLMMAPFDKQKALRWREQLQRALIDKRLRPAFDALDRMIHNYDGADFPATSYGDESIKRIDGMLRISFRLVRPGNKEADEIAPDAAAWAGISLLTGVNATEFFNTQLKNSSNPDKAFLDALGKQIAEELIERIEIHAVGSSAKRLPLRLELATEFKNTAPLQVRVRSMGALPANLSRLSIDDIEIKMRALVPDGSIEQVMPPGTKMTLETLQLRYSTEHMQHALVSSGRIAENLIDKDGVSLSAPISKEELRNPRSEDKERVNALLRHLHDNIEHYHRAIWQGMDSSRRFMLLDGITAPNANGRSIASVVENRLLGIVGNSLVMPVVPGLQLDPVYQVDPINPVSLLEVYQPTEETAPLLISVPTKGVYAESVMGSCNSCEKKDETRFWRWEESPLPDQPSPIGLLSTDSRRSETPDLTAKDFAQPIINVQNAPNAPDPSGLAAMMQLIGKGDSFRDLTGLNQNQLNAAAALGAGMQSAGDAAQLALQKSMMSDIDQLEEQVKRSVASGTLDLADGKTIMKTAYENAVGKGIGEHRVALKLEREKPVRELEGEDEEDDQGGKNPDVLGQTPPSKSPISVFTFDGDEPNNRSFSPPEKLGVIELKVNLSPKDSKSFEWTVEPSVDPATNMFNQSLTGLVSLDKSTGKKVEITAKRQGLVKVKCVSKNAKGEELDKHLFLLSVPRFVTIELGTAKDALYESVFGASAAFHGTFTDFLANYPSKDFPLVSTAAGKVWDFTDDVLKAARDSADFILRHANVRTLWLPLGDLLPSGFQAECVHRVIILNENPEYTPTGLSLRKRGHELGVTNTEQGFRKVDPITYILPGNLAMKRSATGLDDFNTKLVTLTSTVASKATALFNSDRTAFDEMMSNAVLIVGRIIGENAAHEIGHGLLGTLPPGFSSSHAAKEIEEELMRFGKDRDFKSRTGLDVFSGEPGSNPLPLRGSFIDLGSSFQNTFQKNSSHNGTQDVVDRHFPVLTIELEPQIESTLK